MSAARECLAGRRSLQAYSLAMYGVPVSRDADIISLLSRHLTSRPELYDASAVFQLALLDEPDTECHIVLDRGSVDVLAGRHTSPTLVLTLKRSDLIEMFEQGHLRAQQMFASGQVKLSGDVRGLPFLTYIFPTLAEKVVTPTPEMCRALDDRLAAAPRLARIERLEAPSSAEVQEFARRSQPVVIGGAAADWEVARWDLAQLGARLGGVQIVARDYPPPPEYWKPRAGRTLRLSDYLSLIERAAAGPDPIPYAEFLDTPPELDASVVYPAFFPRAAFGHPKMWLGPAGTITPLHRDWSDNFFVQLIGEKRFVFFSPADAPLLYVQRGAPTHEWSLVDVDHPDLARFPLVGRARPLECVVGPGEMLLIPGGWFHHVRSLSVSFSLNFFLDSQLPCAIADAQQGA